MKEMPKHGEPYNGFKRHTCVLIPVSLISSKDLSYRDLYVYGLLRLEAGDADRVRIVTGAIAKTMGVSDDTIQRSLDELAIVGLIRRTRCQHSLLVTFLWSPLLEGSLQKKVRPDAAALRVGETSDPAEVRAEIPQPCGSDPASVRDVLRNRGFSSGLREDQSSANASRSDAPAAEDDDSRTPPAKNQAAEIAAQVRAFLTARGFPSFSGKSRASDIARLLVGHHGDLSRFGDFLAHYGSRLVERPRVWDHMRVSLEDWIAHPPKEQLARELEAQILREQADRDAEKTAARELDWNTRVALQRAVELVGSGNPIPGIDFVVERLQRLGIEKLKPAELERGIADWECDACAGRGFVGSAVNRTLHYCSCPGGLVDAEIRGPQFLESLQDDANRDTKTRIESAVRELGSEPAANGIGELRIIEESERVTAIIASARVPRVVQESLLRRVWSYLNEPRQLFIRESAGVESRQRAISSAA